MMRALGSRGGSSGSRICRGGMPGAGISADVLGSIGSYSCLGDYGSGFASSGTKGGSGAGFGGEGSLGTGVVDFFRATLLGGA